jgi:hypothetical protein
MAYDIQWLPPLIVPNVKHMSQLDAFFEKIFIKEFEEKEIIYLDYPVVINKPGDPNYSKKVLDHLTTRDNNRSESRGLDLERAKRLLWCPAVISHPNDPNVLNFDYRESDGIIRTYLYLKPFVLDYLVILEKDEQSHEAFIVSSYYIDKEYKKHSYIDKSKKAI